MVLRVNVLWLSSQSGMVYNKRAICLLCHCHYNLQSLAGACYHQRENADRQDSVGCVKPVPGVSGCFVRLLPLRW